MPKTKDKPNKHSARFLELEKKIDAERFHELDEAIALMRETAKAKFVESVDLAVRLGVDPRKGDQNVRGVTSLPHGTGRTRIVAVLAKGEKAADAEGAGADFVGDEDLIKRIQEGDKSLKFDVMLAATDMAPQIGKIGRFLGPRTPNKRNGTVTDDIKGTVAEIKKAARIEYRLDKAAIVHMQVGKVSFTDEQIRENILAAVNALIKAKPSTAKGRYLVSATLSSTMGPGVRLDVSALGKLAG
jgi:large subunit ribosomal protein L1